MKIITFFFIIWRAKHAVYGFIENLTLIFFLAFFAFKYLQKCPTFFYYIFRYASIKNALISLGQMQPVNGKQLVMVTG